MATVACAQLVPGVGDPARNRERAREAVRAAVAAGADLVVLPELCTSGYVFESDDEARAAALYPAAVAEDWGDLGAAVVVGGFAELGDDGTLYNSAADGSASASATTSPFPSCRAGSRSPAPS
jgi:5-aminopentanamidase